MGEEKNSTSRQTANMEDYLETIYTITREGRPVKVTQISKALGVRKPSAVGALRKLSGEGLVLHERYGDVELTAAGAEVAQDVFRRHEMLRQFLVDILDVDPEIAEEDACRMEHVLSTVSMERLGRFLDFVLECPQGKSKLLKGLEYYFAHGKRDKKMMADCQGETKRV